MDTAVIEETLQQALHNFFTTTQQQQHENAATTKDIRQILHDFPKKVALDH